MAPSPQVQAFLESWQGRWLLYVTLLFFTWMVARLISRLLLERLMHLRHMDSTIIHFLGRLFVFLSLLVATFLYANLLFQANLAAAATTLGLLSLALGFGLQNTIANMAGGVSLALDRPFRLGDQVQVGSTVGDVQQIGIRSTRILTLRRELVVIPNRLLEEQAIINYTMAYPDLRLDLPVPVSYEADPARAEEIMLEIAVAHPVVLRTPEPRVLMRRFSDHGIDLELRCWVSHPRNQAVVQSDLLKALKDRFDAEGIEIGHVYRPAASKAEGTKSRRVKGGPGASGPAQRRMLVPFSTARLLPAQSEYVVNLAKALRSQLIALYVAPPGEIEAAEEANRMLQALARQAEAQGIWFKPILRSEGRLVQMVRRVAEEENVDLVLLGLGRGRFPLAGRWSEGAELTREELTIRGIRVPTHEVPHSGKLSEGKVAELEARIEAYRNEQPKPSLPAVPVSPPEPTTSAVPTPPPEGPRGAQAGPAPGTEAPKKPPET